MTGIPLASPSFPLLFLVCLTALESSELKELAAFLTQPFSPGKTAEEGEAASHPALFRKMWKEERRGNALSCLGNLNPFYSLGFNWFFVEEISSL